MHPGRRREKRGEKEMRSRFADRKNRKVGNGKKGDKPSLKEPEGLAATFRTESHF